MQLESGDWKRRSLKTDDGAYAKTDDRSRCRPTRGESVLHCGSLVAVLAHEVEGEL
jgi:hypothetical protein